MYNYEIIMFWSDEDSCFITEISELTVCIAHGSNEEETLKNIKEAKDLWIERATELGRDIPKPKGRLIFA